MRKSDTVPDYLIDSISRHVRTILYGDRNSNKYKNAERLLKKEIIKLESSKKK